MEDNDSTVGQDQLPAAPPQTRLASYNLLVRLSKRMGTVATKSFVEVRQFLNQDITVDPTERFLAGMPRLRLQKRNDDGEGGGGRPPQAQGQQEGEREKAQSTENGESKVDVRSDNLEKIISQSHEVLAEANTVFPITLFPDTVLVDRTKVTIIKRDFFWSSDTMTFRIEDVLNAEVTVGPLFGSLTIASRVMSTTDHFRIDHFWRNDAIYLKQIIQGYVIAQHNKIDVAHLPKEELIKTLNELGRHRT